MPSVSRPVRRRRVVFAGAALLAAAVGAASDVRARADAAIQASQPASPAASQAVPRAEHPRPDFMRADWATLNGKWEFEFDDGDAGLRERWFAGTRPFSKTIVVPYTFQSKLSGIGDTALPRRGLVPAHVRGAERLAGAARAAELRRGRLRGHDLGERRGCGTASRRPRELRARRHRSPRSPATTSSWCASTTRDGHDHPARQAGTWKPKSESIFYTRTTGLWQPVWIEAAGTTRIGTAAHHARRGQVAGHASRPTSCPRCSRRPGTGEAPPLRLRADVDARRGRAGSAGGERQRHAGHGRDHARRPAPVAPRSARALRPDARDPVRRHGAWTGCRATSGSAR